MFNRVYHYFVCVLFLLSVHLSCFGSILDNIEDIKNCTDVNRKIDYFIEAGMEYQKSTGKKFHYKKFLKKTFKYLEDNGVELPKSLKSDIKQLVQDRIEQGYYCSKSANTDGSFKNETMHRYKNEEPESNNQVRSSVFTAGVGVLMTAAPCPLVQLAGAGIAGSEVTNLIGYAKEGLSNYFWPEKQNRSDHRDTVSNGRRAERENDKF